VSEQIPNGTSAQSGYILYIIQPFTSLENTGQKTNQKHTLPKLNTTPIVPRAHTGLKDGESEGSDCDEPMHAR